MTSPILECVRGIAADVLQVPARQITPQSSTETIGSWDSVHHLNLILALEQEFDTQFDPEDIDKMTSIERIVDVVANKGKPG
jgi:acyl carrier protein